MYLYYQEHADCVEFYTDSVDFETMASWMGHRAVHVDFFLGYDSNDTPVVKDDVFKKDSLGFKSGGFLKDLDVYLKENDIWAYEYGFILDGEIDIGTAEPVDLVIRMPMKGHEGLLPELFEILELDKAILEYLFNKQGIMFKVQDGELQPIGEYPDLDEWHQKHFNDKWDADEFTIN